MEDEPADFEMIQKQSETENLRVVPLNSAPLSDADHAKKVLRPRVQNSAGPQERRGPKANEGSRP